MVDIDTALTLSVKVAARAGIAVSHTYRQKSLYPLARMIPQYVAHAENTPRPARSF